MAMDVNAIKVVFTAQGYAHTRDTTKLDEYKAPTTGQFLYVYKDRDLSSSIQVVIHPGLKVEPFIDLAGVTCPKSHQFRHGSNMRQFPKRKNRGERETPYGQALEVDSLESLTRLLQLLNTPAGSEQAGADMPPRLTAIELENFKGVGERVRIELAPITLLFGANSAGKSTILQALQYVREVLERRNANPDRTLHGGDFVDLGGFHNLVHQRDPKLRIGIKLELELNRASLPDLVPDSFDEWQTFDEDVWEFYNLLQETKNLTESVSIELKIGWSNVRQSALVLGYEVGINGELLVQITSSEDGRDASIKINKQNPVFLRYHTQAEIDAGAAILFDLSTPTSSENDESVPLHSPADISKNADDDNEEYSVYNSILYTLSEANLEKPGQGFRQWLHGFDGALPKLEPLLYTPTGGATGAEAVYIAREFTAFLSSMTVGPAVLIRNQLRNLRYLGPIRNVPTRDFDAALTPDEARWADGTSAWEMLLTADAALVGEVSDWMSSPDKLATGYEVERREYSEVDPAILDLLVRAADGETYAARITNEINELPRKRRIRLIEQHSGLTVQPRDVGIGISQVLPVVVAALEPSASLVAIEQPELHIHPAVQVGLGDLLIKGSKEHGISFLVETHSEHLILRLLRRIRETSEGELPAGFPAVSADILSVLYVGRGEKGVTITPLSVDETGEFAERWPKGFFEERAAELF